MTMYGHLSLHCSFHSCVLLYAFLLVETSTEGEKIFNSVLSCKRRADITRNALSVLQRYRFLFNLPKTIEMNIKNVRIYTLCGVF